jgi:hypothetical protein
MSQNNPTLTGDLIADLTKLLNDPINQEIVNNRQDDFYIEEWPNKEMRVTVKTFFWMAMMANLVK